MLLETLVHPISEPPTSSCPSNFCGSVMKELTLVNFKFPDVNISGCSGSVKNSTIRKGLWQNFRRIAGGSRINSARRELAKVEDNTDIFGPSTTQSSEERNLQIHQFSLDHLKTPHNAVESDNRDLSRINLACHPPGFRTRVSPASGFRHFMANSTLKGKSVVHCEQRTYNEPINVTQSQNNVGIDDNKVKFFESLDKPSGKRGEITLLRGSDGYADSIVHHEMYSLRDWFKHKHHSSNRFERLQMFKQILKLVDVSHSQGCALQHLKPSFLVLSPSSLVKYIGSVIPQVQTGNWMCSTYQDDTQESQLKRKRSMQYDLEYQSSLSHKQLKQHHGQVFQGTLKDEIQGTLKDKIQGEKHHIYPSRAGLHVSFAEEVYDANIKTSSFDVRFSEQVNMVDSYQSSSIPGCQNNFPHSFRQPISGFLNLEDKWYACPEKLNDNACSLSSNIYSLGVLFFELFCSFEVEEAHFAAMANLRHRILPPFFLSECPKEAGFCLWLLHPDPSSRPKSREILSSNLIGECYNFSAKDQPSASIDEEDAEADLLLIFLSSLKEQKENQVAKILADIQCLETDAEEVESRHLSRVGSLSDTRGLTSSNGTSNLRQVSIPIGTMSSQPVSTVNEGRLMENIDQLKHAYFSVRSNFENSEANTTTRSGVGVLQIRDNFRHFQHGSGIKGKSEDRLGCFFEGLCKYARYSRFEVCGSLRNADILNSANVICSLSFDRDEDYFAAAGVSKKIKIFEFGALLSDDVDVHYPLVEMSSRSKLSCVSWNNYIKNYLASTDYEGVVQLWDASTGEGFTRFAEHEKRAWSVDFSTVDPTKLASGSDDCSVKLWSINEKNCIDTIRTVANVCCVQFSPHSSHLLTFGTADYKIYCYDMRNSRYPWCALSGHGKAVSYVKFVDSETIVSASTDNTLKLWDLKKSIASGLSTNACSMTLTGHTNEKNFVGLTAFDGYIACGSETNEVFSYYKTLPMPVTSHKFGSIDPITGQETGDDNEQFVSSVCWRTKSNMVVCANSTGSLKLLKLV
ncbi:Protein SUPPRESSOR OF PHYA-105 1 [Platanthera guangdongensis]|uniref:Protein SUPPRESSOR OF PHYA-105 1 n=1 Tax=Platanthera guangdongensis TaxID=2320717 RepID=A0ABR2MM93_9ASPA